MPSSLRTSRAEPTRARGSLEGSAAPWRARSRGRGPKRAGLRPPLFVLLRTWRPVARLARDRREWVADTRTNKLVADLNRRIWAALSIRNEKFLSFRLGLQYSRAVAGAAILCKRNPFAV